MRIKEVHKLLKDGVKVTYRTADDEEAVETVKVIDWETPGEQRFLPRLAVLDFWRLRQKAGRPHRLRERHPACLHRTEGISQGIWRTPTSYNLSDYRTTIPQVFWYNAVIILSNGSKSKIGSITAGWEHFAEWKKINDEGEEGVVSLETMIRGVCDPTRLLDLVENFTHLQRG